MKKIVYFKSIFCALLLLLLNIQAVFSAPATKLPIPPPAAIPEGNLFTAAAIVGYGVYKIWMQGRSAG